VIYIINLQNAVILDKSFDRQGVSPVGLQVNDLLQWVLGSIMCQLAIASAWYVCVCLKQTLGDSKEEHVSMTPCSQQYSKHHKAVANTRHI